MTFNIETDFAEVGGQRSGVDIQQSEFANARCVDYVTTYVERDVKDVREVGDLATFRTFVRLCAGRTAQEVNYSALGADAGISHTTAKAWLSVLAWMSTNRVTSKNMNLPAPKKRMTAHDMSR